MKKLALVASFLAISAVSASAADMAARPYTKAPPVMVEPGYNWSGFYLGGQAGGAWLRANEGFINDAGNLDPLTFDSANSFIGGGHAGLQGQWGTWVLGVEGTYNWTDLHETVPSINPGFPRVRSLNIDNTASVVGKVGYTGGPWLLYVKGGWADLRINATSLLPTTGLSSSSGNNWHSGWTVGGGLDYQFSRNWIGGIDGNYYRANFNGVQTFSNGQFGSVVNSKAEVYSVTARLSYLFSWGNAPVAARY